MTRILGLRKQKKALLKNAKNLKEISDLYYEKISYEIVYPDETIVKQKYKYKVSFILNKFHINSMNELVFLLIRHCKKLIGTCKFCGEECYSVELRTNGEHIEKCDCVGICKICKNPTNGFNKDQTCYECMPYRVEISENNYYERFIYSMSYASNEEIHQNYKTIDEIDWVINRLENSLQLFNQLKSMLTYQKDNKNEYKLKEGEYKH